MSAPARWVICGKCDAREPLNAMEGPDRLHRKGWIVTPGPNYCPACAKQNEYERKRAHV